MIKPVILFADPVLRAVGAKIAEINGEVQQLAADMLDTMRSQDGVGLAAQQVGVALQLAVVDIREVEDRPSKMWINGEEVDPLPLMPMVLINPRITWASDERVKGEEGCLSVPGIYDGVERATSVKVVALDGEGQEREIAAEGLMAVCIQHEMDHLMGKVFVEYLSPLKRNRIKTKLLKALRDEEA
jgi:peptide deformylase